MDVCFKNKSLLPRLFIVVVGISLAGVCATEKVQEVQSVNSGSDAKKLIGVVTAKLKEASKRQITRLEQSAGQAFKADKKLIQQQQAARTRIADQVLPVLTRKVETTVENNKPARMRIIDGEKIADLSTEQMLKVLENLASGLRMLPPLPDQVSAWARTVAPLLSFDKKTQAMMSDLVNQWFDVLLKSETDLGKLARISADDKAQQHQLIAGLRGNYKDNYHNASQLLYPWIQIALLINNRDPLGTWLEYATDNPKPLRAKFKKLVEKAARDSSSEADARGFVLLAIASLFAPEALFKQLASKSDGQGAE